MAIFSSLPQELIDHIVKLAVEGDYDWRNVRLRRSILIKLALVSKAFVLPSQRALWAIIIRYDSIDSMMDQLSAGLAKDFIIESFTYDGKKINDDAVSLGRNRHYKLIHLLENVKGVIELSFPSDVTIEGFIPRIFHLPSTRYIRSLRVIGFEFGFQETEIPPLRSLEWGSYHHDSNKNKNPIFQLLEEQPTSTLTAITFAGLSMVDYQLNFSNYLRIHGSCIQFLKLLWVDADIIKLILPHTPLLKDLRAIAIKDISEACTIIQLLSKHVPLRNLELSQVLLPQDRHDTLPNCNFLFPLLNLPQLQHLKLLLFGKPNHILYGINSELSLMVKEELLSSRFNFYVEQCRTKGIELTFFCEEERIYIERLKRQVTYTR